VKSQRERIEEVQHRLYNLLLADNPNETSDDVEAIVLIRQADEALSLAWKLATNGDGGNSPPGWMPHTTPEHTAEPAGNESVKSPPRGGRGRCRALWPCDTYHPEYWGRDLTLLPYTEREDG